MQVKCVKLISDVWAKYVVSDIESENKHKCIIDDLRFQNEADYLKDWTFIALTTPKDLRIERIKHLYPDYCGKSYKKYEPYI